MFGDENIIELKVDDSNIKRAGWHLPSSTNNGLSFTEGLLKLSNYEVDFKEQSASRSMIKAAAFPFVKELKDFDFEFQPSVNEQEMRELTNLGFLEKNENIVFLGPSGVGKTHLATSIGISAN